MAEDFQQEGECAEGVGEGDAIACVPKPPATAAAEHGSILSHGQCRAGPSLPGRLML